jgi:hypothetical protein
MKLFEFEWQEAPGVRDKVLAATWARLSLYAGNLCVSEAIDERSESRRTSIHGSLFPLAEWLVEHWWHLLHEPSPHTPVPGGRAALPWMHGWVQRHNLLAARDGGALPDLTILRDGDDVLLQWEADPVPQIPSRLRFISQGKLRVPVPELERWVASFVETVLARLEEGFPDNEDVKRVVKAWCAIRSADSAEAALCQSLAVMGVDPYDPDEADDSLIESVERCVRVLPDELRADLFEGSGPQSLANNLEWVERERIGLRDDMSGAGFPTVDPVAASTPHELGYLTARRVRSELLGLAEDVPLPDLTSVLVDRLGWARSSRLALAGIPLDGMVGLDAATSDLVLVTADSRSERADRFRLARAAFFPVSRRLGTNARLLTRSATPPQRAARAFAAELLAPSAALANRVSGRLNDEEVENLAVEFSVSPQVILHQVENHGLGYVEP